MIQVYANQPPNTSAAMGLFGNTVVCGVRV